MREGTSDLVGSICWEVTDRDPMMCFPGNLCCCEPQTEPPSWQLLVVGGKVVFQEMEQGTGICLSIDGQIHYFLPESSKELKEWYSALQEAIQPVSEI